jgi:hypothetical protein
VSEDPGSEEPDGWKGALRRLGPSTERDQTPTARSATGSARNDQDERAHRIASSASLYLRAFLTLFWVVGFVASLARGDWAFAALTWILGSLSGFWLSRELADRRSRS